ncbi:hypothetical protein KXW37_003949 [Aspergillus fumigatus]|nr:hypothetical protein KXW37_003949 [Aspergillus fumigatus]
MSSSSAEGRPTNKPYSPHHQHGFIAYAPLSAATSTSSPSPDQSPPPRPTKPSPPTTATTQQPGQLPSLLLSPRPPYQQNHPPPPPPLAEVDPEEVEIKPDGILYLPEIKYRRILNRAFGPGGWGLVPRSESIVTPRTVTREYALVCNGRLVSVARGEQDYFTPDGIPTATEGCRSNALVRCCKDLGIASELWDPRWIRKFKAQYTREVFVEHVVNKKRTKIWVRKDDQVSYPWKETGTK